MAIFGIGAIWNENEDILPEFLRQECACIGWSQKEAPTLYEIFVKVRIGSIMYVKSFNPQGLRIKAVGIVTATHVQTTLKDDSVRVSWLWTGEELVGPFNDRYPVRACTIYEELNPGIQARVVSLLLSALHE